MSEIGEYLREENERRWNERYQFYAGLVLTVMGKLDTPKTWKDIASFAIYEYESNRQRYLDGDVSGILSTSDDGDFWLKPKYISSPNGRKRIRIVLQESGYYIANIVGKGGILTTDPDQIKDDFSRSISAVRGRTKSMSKTAIAINEHYDTTELPVIVMQAMLQDGTADS